MFSKNQIKPPKPVDEAEAKRLEAAIIQSGQRADDALAKARLFAKETLAMLETPGNASVRTLATGSNGLSDAIEPVRAIRRNN